MTSSLLKKHVESVLKSRVFNCLCARLLNVSNQVTAVLLLLKPSKHHLGAGDVLLWVGQVDIKGVLVPGDALVNVSLGVAEASSSSSLSSPDTMQVRSLLVLASSLYGVALGTSLCENLFACVSAHLFSCRSESSNIS